MANKNKKDSGGNASATRDERLKAALKANLARRKAQSRGRAAKAETKVNTSDGSRQEKDR